MFVAALATVVAAAVKEVRPGLAGEADKVKVVAASAALEMQLGVAPRGLQHCYRCSAAHHLRRRKTGRRCPRREGLRPRSRRHQIRPHAAVLPGLGHASLRGLR